MARLGRRTAALWFHTLCRYSTPITPFVVKNVSMCQALSATHRVLEFALRMFWRLSCASLSGPTRSFAADNSAVIDASQTLSAWRALEEKKYDLCEDRFPFFLLVVSGVPKTVCLSGGGP